MVFQSHFVVPCVSRVREVGEGGIFDGQISPDEDVDLLTHVRSTLISHRLLVAGEELQRRTATLGYWGLLTWSTELAFLDSL